MPKIRGISIGQLAQWLGSSKARSWWLIAWVGLYPVMVGSLQAPPEGYYLPIEPWQWDLFLGGGSASVLVVANLLRLQSSLIINLGVWLLAGTLGASLPILVSASTGKPVQENLEAAPFAVLANLGLLLIFTILHASAGEYRRSIGNLEDKIWKLNNRSTWLNAELAGHKSELAGSVASQVEPALLKIKSLAEEGNFELARAELLTLNQGVVRPISSELSRAEFRFESTPKVKARFRSWLGLSRASFRKRIALSVTLSPWLPILFSLLFLVSGAALADPAAGALFFFGFLVSIGFLFVLLQRITRNIELPIPLVVVFSFLVAGGVDLLYALMSRLLGLANISGMSDFVSLGLLLVFISTGLISIYVEAMRQANDDALRLTAELSESVGELQVRIMAIRRRLATRVHGDLQARLQGLLVLASRWENLGNEEKVRFFSELDQATRQVNEDTLEGENQFSLLQLSKQWAGICEVSVTLSKGVEKLLVEDAGLAELTFEIARERVINAVKHSAAEEIDVVIEIESGDLVVRTRNENFGVVRSAAEQPGVGSRLLDSACKSWALDFEDEDVVFEARIELFGTKG